MHRSHEHTILGCYGSFVVIITFIDFIVGLTVASVPYEHLLYLLYSEGRCDILSSLSKEYTEEEGRGGDFTVITITIATFISITIAIAVDGGLKG